MLPDCETSLENELQPNSLLFFDCSMSLLTLQLFLDEGFDSNFYEGLDLARLSVQFLKRQLRDIMRLLRSPLPSLSLQTPPEDPTRRPRRRHPPLVLHCAGGLL